MEGVKKLKRDSLPESFDPVTQGYKADSYESSRLACSFRLVIIHAELFYLFGCESLVVIQFVASCGFNLLPDPLQNCYMPTDKFQKKTLKICEGAINFTLLIYIHTSANVGTIIFEENMHKYMEINAYFFIGVSFLNSYCIIIVMKVLIQHNGQYLILGLPSFRK